MKTLTLIGLVLCSALGCSRSESASSSESAPTPTEPRSATADKPRPTTSTWIEGDFATAVAAAKQRQAPILVELWAAWCSACMEMKNTVLHSAAIDAYHDRLVFVAIDRERKDSAALLELLEVPVSPSYYVVSAGGDKVLARQLGATSVEGFSAFLDAGLERHRLEQSGQPAPDSAIHLALDGDRQALSGQLDEALRLYQTAYEKAPANWERLGDLALAWAVTLRKAERFERCAEVAAELLPRVAARPRGYLGNLAFEAEMCSRKISAAAAERTRSAIIAAVDSNQGRADGPPCALERSVALQMKRYALLGLGKDDQARAVAVEERRILDEEAGKKTRPQEIMPYRFIAVEVYAFLGAQDELIEPVEELARALPDHYHPPFVLAQIAAIGGDLDRAAQLAEQAAQKAYGPQKGEVLALAATIAEARGAPDAKEARRAVRDYFESLPASQRGTAAEHDALSPDP